MLDLGWTELLVIGIVALIVVGPKDLPGMFRAVGNFVGKAKRMAREFSKAMNDAADEAGVSDVKKTFDSASNPMKSAMNEVEKSTESFTAKTMAGPEEGARPRAQGPGRKDPPRSAEMAEERKAREARPAAGGADEARPRRRPAARRRRRETASAAGNPPRADRHRPRQKRRGQARDLGR